MIGLEKFCSLYPPFSRDGFGSWGYERHGDIEDSITIPQFPARQNPTVRWRRSEITLRSSGTDGSKDLKRFKPVVLRTGWRFFREGNGVRGRGRCFDGWFGSSVCVRVRTGGKETVKTLSFRERGSVEAERLTVIALNQISAFLWTH